MDASPLHHFTTSPLHRFTAHRSPLTAHCSLLTLIATMSREGDGPADLDLVATHYAGKKQHLRPIYDAIIKHVAAFGKDVELSPKKAYVSLRRNKQFACVGPATNTAIEVGLNLTGTQTTDRLQKATGMVSHRVRIESPKDVDKQLVGWLRDAYERG